MSLLGRQFRFLSLLRSHGEVVRIYLGPLPVYLVTSPEFTWQVLATNADSFDKGRLFDKLRSLFGNGLVIVIVWTFPLFSDPGRFLPCACCRR